MNNNTNTYTATTPVQRMTALLLILIGVTVVYSGTLDNPFIWDDVFLIEQNVLIQNLHNIGQLFTKNYFSQSIEISYRPITTLTYMVNYALWGNQTAGYHFTNIAIHIINSLLLFALAARLLGRPWLGIALALLFALHPVNTEAVNAVTFREDPLCLMFTMFSFLLYTGYSRGGRGGGLRIAGSLLFFTAALFTKETCVVFPAVIFAYEYFSVERPKLRKAFGMAALYSAPALFFLYMRFFAMIGPSESYVYHGGGPWDTLLLMLQAGARYVTLIIWPARQCVDHMFPDNPRLLDPATLSALFVILALVAFAVIATARRRIAGFGFAWFVLMMFPVSNIIPIGVVMAERYLYMALPGFLIFAGAALKEIFLSQENSYPSLSRVFLGLALTVLIILGGAAAANRNKAWDTEAGFWEQAYECAPTSARVMVNLGISYMNENRLADAETILVRSVRAASEASQSDIRYGCLYRALTNLGIVYARNNRLDAALKLLSASAAIYPDSAYSHLNLGVVFLRLGKIEDAEREFVKGIELQPNNISAGFYLVTIYHQMGRTEKAVEECNRILEISPGQDRALKLKEAFLTELEEQNAPGERE